MGGTLTRRTIPPTSWDDVIARLQQWAQETDAVRGMVLVGSRARSDRPADRWSDLDLLVATDDREHTILDDTWLPGIADVWATLVRPGPLPDAPVRQIVFEGGYDVDLVALPPERFHGETTDEIVADLLARGHRVLLDKDHQLDPLPTPGTASSPTLPDAQGLLWAINDLFVQFVWASKHLRRGEVWQAKDDLDGYMHNRLLSLIEWHAIAHGRPTATWKGSSSGGRGLAAWADPRVLEFLPGTFATYSPTGVADALRNLLDLIGWLGPEVATAVGADYPRRQHDALRAWLDQILQGQVERNG